MDTNPFNVQGASEGAAARVRIERLTRGFGWAVYFRQPKVYDPENWSLADACFTKWGARFAARRLLRRLRLGMESEEIR